MPAPLTPLDCDLQDYPFMPLHVARLRDSDLAAEEDPEACWYAVLLWAASWHQLPSASLPDNDAVLTKLIGLGRDLKTFRKHKAGALRGFIRCDDGRLYHPIVAEQALVGWRGKLEQRWRTECARIKKRNQRDETDHPQPTFEEFMATLPESSRLPSVPRDNEACPQGHGEMSPGTDTPCPQGNGIQERERGTGTGTGIGIYINPQKPPEGAFSPEFEQAWADYAEDGKATSNREASFSAWEPEALAVGADRLAACVGAYTASLRAKGDRAKSAPKFHVWLREKRYEAFLKDRSPARAACAWAGPADVLAAVERHKGRDWAVAYLAKCRWDAEVRTLTAPSVTAGMLRQEAASSLRAIGVEIHVEPQPVRGVA